MFYSSLMPYVPHIACFHSFLDKASDTFLGISMVRLTRKALWEGENCLKDRKLESGYIGRLVHSLVLFLTVGT